MQKCQLGTCLFKVFSQWNSKASPISYNELGRRRRNPRELVDARGGITGNRLGSFPEPGDGKTLGPQECWKQEPKTPQGSRACSWLCFSSENSSSSSCRRPSSSHTVGPSHLEGDGCFLSKNPGKGFNWVLLSNVHT